MYAIHVRKSVYATDAPESVF